jgi:hypothetical protein
MVFLTKLRQTSRQHEAAHQGRSQVSHLGLYTIYTVHLSSVFRIRIRKFLGLANPEQLVRGPDPGPSITREK